VQTDLAGLQEALLKTDTVDQFLRELAALTARTVSDDSDGDGSDGDGGAMSCGMALRQRGRPEPVIACSDPVAAEADRVQAQSGDGPVLHALRHARPVRVHDTATHDRWPRFCRRAMSLGIRSCYAVPLVTEDGPAGALALYARKPGAFGPAETERARRFAGHAVGALTLSLRLASCADQNDQLRSSLVSRAVIDQALGVIMATERCPQDKAFALLRSASQNTNVKLRELAATIVTNVSGEPPKPAAPFQDG
jgi:GAF domain-containing protein